jgi:hypothetical protein
MIRKSQLLTLPNELLEFILSLVCLQNARDIHPCRLTCRTLNTVIARSARMQYLERAALLGVYDPLVEDATVPTVSERMAELCAWDDAWRNIGDILQQREPDARIESPDVHIYDGLHPIRPSPELDYEYFLGPRFIVAVRKAPHTRPGYSYIDLHVRSSLDPAGDASGQGHGNEYREKYWSWTTVEVPIRGMHVSVVSPEVDLVVAMACVSPSHSLFFFLTKLWG